ncbi:hypothetical protein J1N35_024307 [Gossypium stocksii]|uniref:valine--tRNA ligase n=1 Tax=Gossypium stocksii TaxID=47602 RepID=A0A9D4A2W1_9ROSI|nr:hypothetical protein J1N35_024307 [Gossypium stocksii]
MVRYHRMRGRPTLWLPGTDHAGAVIEAFIRLHEKGLIYQGSYMVNWSPKLQTAVSELEVEYSEEPGTLYYIKYHVAGGSRSDFLKYQQHGLKLCLDERYSKYVGKMAIVPMTYGHHVPIISDKISPGHDHNDYVLARKLALPILNVMNKDGTLNEETDLAVTKEPHSLRVLRSQRGGEAIEPLVSKQ